MKAFPISIAISALTAMAITGAVASAASTPSAAADKAATTSGATVWIDALANDTVSDGQGWLASSLQIVSGPNAGWAGIDPYMNQLTYTAPANWAGTATFTYQVCDTSGACATAQVTVTVAAPVPPAAAAAPTEPVINIWTEGLVFADR